MNSGFPDTLARMRHGTTWPDLPVSCEEAIVILANSTHKLSSRLDFGSCFQVRLAASLPVFRARFAIARSTGLGSASRSLGGEEPLTAPPTTQRFPLEVY